MSGSLHEAVTAYAAALAPDVAHTVRQARSALTPLPSSSSAGRTESRDPAGT